MRRLEVQIPYPEASHCCPILLVQKVTQLSEFALLYAQPFDHIIYGRTPMLELRYPD